jgi:hypothetical protein
LGRDRPLLLRSPLQHDWVEVNVQRYDDSQPHTDALPIAVPCQNIFGAAVEELSDEVMYFEN